ncbi:putative glutathione-specific gamma-glutamylcyclotransferase, gamma-glutamyl cyclotransferase [Helianthus debilis subsp. tardiflorus]
MAAMWVFGYGSLIWKAGFHHDDRLVGFIKDYRRVFYQGSTDHRGTPEYPGRTVTLEPAPGELCWGVAYKVSRKEDQEVALTYLEVREKQYDKKEYVDFFTKETWGSSAAVTGVMVQIVHAEGPSGPNRDYLFNLEKTLLQMGKKIPPVNFIL